MHRKLYENRLSAQSAMYKSEDYPDIEEAWGRMDAKKRKATMHRALRWLSGVAALVLLFVGVTQIYWKQAPVAGETEVEVPLVNEVTLQTIGGATMVVPKLAHMEKLSADAIVISDNKLDYNANVVEEIVQMHLLPTPHGKNFHIV